MVTLIVTSPGNTQRRKLLRKTQNTLAYLDGIVFLNVFVVGFSSVSDENAAISLEAEKYGDILQYNGADGYS